MYYVALTGCIFPLALLLQRGLGNTPLQQIKIGIDRLSFRQEVHASPSGVPAPDFT